MKVSEQNEAIEQNPIIEENSVSAKGSSNAEGAGEEKYSNVAITRSERVFKQKRYIRTIKYEWNFNIQSDIV